MLDMFSGNEIINHRKNPKSVGLASPVIVQNRFIVPLMKVFLSLMQIRFVTEEGNIKF
jgi:hypothetical protein